MELRSCSRAIAAEECAVHVLCIYAARNLQREPFRDRAKGLDESGRCAEGVSNVYSAEFSVRMH